MSASKRRRPHYLRRPKRPSEQLIFCEILTESRPFFIIFHHFHHFFDRNN